SPPARNWRGRLPLTPMQCAYFDSARCRSCTLMGEPYAAQLASKQDRCTRALAPFVAPTSWLPPSPSREAGFRNKAKLVVGGSPGRVTIGILDEAGVGVDLRECGLYEPGLAEALPLLADFVDEARLEPYDVASRRGELKHLIVTRSPDDELMIRFVARSRKHETLLRKLLPTLQRRIPSAAVVSLNLQPEHKAVLEGDREIVLTDRQLLPMDLGGVTLQLRPNSFFQTNTAVAAALYAQARDWIGTVSPETLWDLYCGVGGFALHAATAGSSPPREVLGVELSSQAIESARTSAASLAAAGAITGRLRFEVGDATTLVHRGLQAPDAVVVNPPRRGIGRQLAGWLEGSAVRHVVYSSCNVESLARDLAAMPGLRPVAARLFDMFPQTTHHEVMVLLERT
ncbi:MAG TPA: 23S rRNA (uracil(747)-C(5))-methyltransferase RlmC, partial [Intrasporangium sp.]|nr:23S rRNA (uracil(747)-C(5))-methyltransferase RlmC [Intrasporangium sp.]